MSGPAWPGQEVAPDQHDAPVQARGTFIANPSAPLQTLNTQTNIADTGADNSRADNNQAFQQRAAIRTEFMNNQSVKDFRTVSSSTKQILALAGREGTAMGDLGLIFSYMKALDPGSTVREGEQASAQNAAGVPDQVRNAYNKLISGERLAPEQRRDMAETAIELYKARAQGYNSFAQTYRGLIQELGADPDKNGISLAPDLKFEPQQAPGSANAPTNADIYANGIKWGDQPENGSFDREAYIRENWPALAGKEDLLVGFWNAQRGNQNLTPEAVKQWYAGQGIPAPSDADMATMIGQATEGRKFAGLDVSAAEQAYHATLDKILADKGENPESATAAVGLGLGQGVMWNSMDELHGAGSAGNALFNGGDLHDIQGAYQVNRDLVRREVERAGNAHPILSTLSEVAGGALTAPVGFRGVQTAGEAAKAGAKVGAVMGFNSGEGAADSAAQAGFGAAAGAALSAGGAKLGDWFTKRAANRAAARAAQPAVQAAPSAAPFTVSGSASRAVPETAATAPLSPVDQAEIASLAKAATGWGPQARSARKTLARKAAANPEAKAAAERLGIDAPPDILSDDAQVQSLTGLARSQVGSDAELAWRTTTARVAEQADQALTDLGGTGDLAQLSDDVLRRLDGTAESLQRQASTLREEVNAAITPGERVDATNLQGVVAGLIKDYGGLAEAKIAMTPQEKSLLAMLGEGDEAIRPTYARLNRLRDDIGEALSKGKGPWADVNRHQLGEYYRALADDQLAAVKQMGGAELAEKQKAANSLFSQMYDQRTQLQELFGKNLERSLAPLLKRSIASGAKGDGKDISLVLERIPEDVRGPAMVSAILAQSRTSAAHGGFSFANFTKLYRGLRQNSPIYGKIAKAIGPEGERILTDLYVVANRMADGETKVLKTGKANQVLSSALQAESVVGNILSAATDRAASAIGTAAGGAVGGPGGAVAGATIVGSARRAISGAGKSRLDKAHNLLSSPEFRALINRMANGADASGGLNGLWNSPAFHRFAKSAGYTTPEARRKWLNGLASSQSVHAANDVGLPQSVSSAFSLNPAQLAAQPNIETSTKGGAAQ